MTDCEGMRAVRKPIYEISQGKQARHLKTLLVRAGSSSSPTGRFYGRPSMPDERR